MRVEQALASGRSEDAHTPASLGAGNPHHSRTGDGVYQQEGVVGGRGVPSAQNPPSKGAFFSG